MSRLLNRRQWISNVSGAIAGFSLLPAVLLADEPQTRLTGTSGYLIDMQSDGKISIGEEEKKHEIPFSVTCQQEFQERLILRDDIRLATRKYKVAKLQKRFGNQESEQVELSTGQSAILAFAENVDSGRMEFRTSANKLSEDQWNLLQTPLSPIWLNQLAEEMLGSKPRLTVGDRIEVSEILAARLFCIETPDKSSLVCEVEKANESQAVLKLSGQISGRVLDVDTEFKINASLRCVFADAKITQLRASFVESRQEGGIHPQFSASTKMKLDLKEEVQEIDNGTVRELVALAQQPAILSYVCDQNPIQLQHSSQWHLVLDRRGEVTWRMVASGEALTQCKLLLLATKSEDEVSLDDWVEVVKTAHQEIDAEIINQETLDGEMGSQIHRVEVRGRENDTDLAWIHYFVSFPDGTRGELAFTTDKDFVPTLAETDRLMAQSLTQNDLKIASANEKITK